MMIDYELYPHSVAILCSNSWKGKKKINFFHINYHVLQIPGIRK